MKTTEFNGEVWRFNTPFGVPPFGKFSIEDYRIAFEVGIAELKEEIQSITENKEEPTFKNTVIALDRAGALLSMTESTFSNESSLNSSEEIRAFEEKITPVLSKLSNETLFNPLLFEKISILYKKKDSLSLEADQLFLLENLYREFTSNGANLAEEEKKKLMEINQNISSLALKFSNNVLAETNNYRLVIEREEDLAGLPSTARETAAKKAEKADMKGKWIFSLHAPSYTPFLKFADKRELREELYKMYTKRANNNDEFDNKEIFAEIICAKTQRAQLLGHKSHSHFILQERMAKTPEKVFELLNKISNLALPVAKENNKELQDYLKKQAPELRLESWDISYISEKIRKEKYDINENEVKPYFQLEKVQAGMFAVATKLYGITFQEQSDIPTPHPTATAYRLQEADGKYIGILYLDLFAREPKQQGAWFSEYHKGCAPDGSGKHPIGIIACNFAEATKDAPSLLNLREVETMFHEFGHALDFLLSKNKYNSSHIAWDFVELPSQIMEHWATEPEVLNMYAKHWETGEIIPEELVQKLKNASHFNNGIAIMNQISFGLLDMSYHMLEDTSQLNVAEHENNLFHSIGLTGSLRPGLSTTFFSHIVGGYDSGYYGYMWAAVLDNDAYQVFKEKGIFNQETAAKFRKCILEPNGLKDAMEMFVDFLGREPEIKPLLKHKGLI